MTGGDLAINAVLVVSTVGSERCDRATHLVEQGPFLRRIVTSPVVSDAAAIRPVSASTAMCSLRHDRRVFVPCFSSSHSPKPYSLIPVLSTNR